MSGIISVQTTIKPRMDEPIGSNKEGGDATPIVSEYIPKSEMQDEDRQKPKDHTELTPLSKENKNMNTEGKFDSMRAIRRYELRSDASAPTEIRNGRTAAATSQNTPVVKHVIPSEFSKSIDRELENTQKKEHYSKPKDLGPSQDLYKPNVTEAEYRASLHHQASD